jgi:D-3-phosphoglycerate dehydrogenase / 2-oxoglutarate reductase
MRLARFVAHRQSDARAFLTARRGLRVATNRKRLLIPNVMGEGGRKLLMARDDVEVVPFPTTIESGDFQALLAAGDVDGAILGLTRFGEAECALTPALQVVARIGVGYDAIDVGALTRRRVPLMLVGTANSSSVAEHALFLMLALAKRAAELDALVRAGRWGERLTALPMDLIGKTVLVVGFGRTGTRVAKRCLAMEMNVIVYDPYLPPASMQTAGCEPVSDLEAALPRADFVTVHCPKTSETIGMFGAARLGCMKKTAYLVNTARGGIVEETALYAALTAGTIAGAGIDVFEQEPPAPDHPLLRLANVVMSPHMAGVTRESIDRMAVQAAKNVLSVFDGNPIRENAVNPEVFG